MSQAGIYSELKPVWWYAREGKLPDSPKQVQLILSDLCNQDCSFCAYRMSGYTSNELFMGDSKAAKYGHDNPKRWIPTDRALALMNEFKNAGVLAVQFTGGGEPTVHPKHEAIFNRALALELHCSLVSNGLKWSSNLVEEILPKFDWIRVSIDAGDADAYAKIRRTPMQNWDNVWANVIDLRHAILRWQSDTRLGLGFVVTPESFQGIPEFARLARDAGVNNIRYTAMFSTEAETPFLRIYDRICDLIKVAKDLATPDFAVHDNFGSRFADLKQHAPDYKTCGYQSYTTYIGGDLNSYRCCILAYNKRGLVKGGNLKNRSFSEFWASQERKDDLAALDARGCPRCQFNTKNRQLNYVMSPNPDHKEWP